MSNIKLEVGKKYRNRMGAVVEIIPGEYLSDRYPCVGSDERTYAQNGRYVLDRESDVDLIEEVVEPVKKPHKWAKEIHAIADGIDVEGTVCGGQHWGLATHNENPITHPNKIWRIKPEPKPDVVPFWFVDEWNNIFPGSVSNPYPNLKTIRDGTTGELKDAVVVK